MASHAPVEETTTSLLRRRADGGTDLICPKCETWQDILGYRPLGMSSKYSDALNVIVKCQTCKHIYSPKVLAEL